MSSRYCKQHDIFDCWFAHQNTTTATIEPIFLNETWAHLDSSPGYLTCQIGHAGIGRTKIAGSVIQRVCGMEDDHGPGCDGPYNCVCFA